MCWKVSFLPKGLRVKKKDPAIAKFLGWGRGGGGDVVVHQSNLSQHLDTGCPKLTIVEFVGVLYFNNIVILLK